MYSAASFPVQQEQAASLAALLSQPETSQSDAYRFRRVLPCFTAPKQVVICVRREFSLDLDRYHFGFGRIRMKSWLQDLDDGVVKIAPIDRVILTTQKRHDLKREIGIVLDAGAQFAGEFADRELETRCCEHGFADLFV